MGLDSYSTRKLEQVKNDTQILDEIDKMQLDPDLKEMIRKAKIDSEIEQERERQNNYNNIVRELNSSQTKGLDSMSFSEMNLSSMNNTQNIQQEENITNFSHKYSDSEKKQAQQSIQSTMKKADDLLAMIESSISKYDNSDSLNEEEKNINIELETIKNYDDEHDILKKFQKALEIGKKSVDELIEFTKNNNKEKIENCNRIIHSCNMVFEGHYWGESYKKILNDYMELKLKKLKIDSLSEEKSIIVDQPKGDFEDKTIRVFSNGKEVVYERAIEKYGGGGSSTKYYPIMEDGSMIVEKKSVDNIAILGANCGVLDESKNEKVPCIYDSCKPINSDYYIVGKNYTSDGFSGDDYSLPKQKYGIIDSNGNEIVPLRMYNIFYENGIIHIYDFDNQKYIGILNNGNIEFNEALIITISDSLKDIYNNIRGTNKIASIGRGFILRDGDYATYDEFYSAYSDFVNNEYNFQNSGSESKKSGLPHR